MKSLNIFYKGMTEELMFRLLQKLHERVEFLEEQNDTLQQQVESLLAKLEESE